MTTSESLAVVGEVRCDLRNTGDVKKVMRCDEVLCLQFCLAYSDQRPKGFRISPCPIHILSYIHPTPQPFQHSLFT